jgi:hypothetical protein
VLLLPWWVWGGLAALLLGGAAATVPDEYGEGEAVPEGRAELERWLGKADLPDDLRRFLIVVARRESRFVPTAHNLGDASGSRVAYDRMIAQGWPLDPSVREFGSGGWFGMLPTTAFVAGGRQGPLVRKPAESVYDPRVSIVAAVALAKRLTEQNAWALDPTWTTMRLGWASLGTMADPMGSHAQEVLRRFKADAEAEGFPQLMVEHTSDPSAWPTAETLWTRLGGRSA